MPAPSFSKFWFLQKLIDDFGKGDFNLVGIVDKGVDLLDVTGTRGTPTRAMSV